MPGPILKFYAAVASMVLVACGTPFPSVDDQQLTIHSPRCRMAAKYSSAVCEPTTCPGPRGAASLRNLRVATTGSWPWLVTKVQPLMTDDDWRTDGDEFLDLQTGYYEALFTGPAGSKRVLRTPQAR